MRCIKFFLRHFHRCYRADRCRRTDSKAFRCLCDIIGVAHPADCLFFDIAKQKRRLVHFDFCLSVFADRCCLHCSTERICHQLGTIADSENRDTKFKNFFLITWGFFCIYTVWSTGKYNPFRVHFLDLIDSKGVWVYFAVYMTLSDTSGNQLIVLAAKIKHNNEFFIQRYFLLLIIACFIYLKIITFFTHFVYWKSYVQVLSDMKAAIQKTLPAAGRLFAAGRAVYSIPNAR